MFSSLRTIVLSGALLLLGAPAALAQGADWSPPSRQMPTMPGQDELASWVASHDSWFQGVDRVAGVEIGRLRAAGEHRAGSDVLQVARFMDGPIPAVIWSDRNGDRRADLIEILRSGGVIVQLIDADYDGAANVLRVYDPSGALLREEWM